MTTVQDKSSVMVVVTADLESQHFLGEWTGEVVTGELMQIRNQAKLYLKDRPCVLGIGNDLFIDSTSKGSVCR